MNGTSDIPARINEAEGRIAQMVFIGTVSEVDYKSNRYRLKSGELESDWLPLLQNRAGGVRTHEPRHKGEQVLAVSPSGDMSQAVIMGSLPTNERGHVSDRGSATKTIYEDGTVIEHDSEAKALTVKAPAGLTLNVSVGDGALTLTDQEATLKVAKITLDGDVKVTGGLDGLGGRFHHKGKFVGNTHRHTGVVPGNGLSKGPV
ncbi:phage-related baseplate assembly protein V [Roseibium sp. TrichSKD4]|uniref:phage baseplate assembly protein V n=1 Tax=Roseibium sp. TrichSKD4 TaxID=744980 RepID=UPI0001E56F4F|nr:phage baseplate assembly protein V [Roseibium sp. TrichSKD4]EFO31338.1 phage-related baseplate assembly protein V [Roseibium sp. TrichSKD4]